MKKTGLHFKFGNAVDGYTEITADASDALKICTPGGEELYEIIPVGGGAIEVRLTGCALIDGVRYTTELVIEPRVSNVIVIRPARPMLPHPKRGKIWTK